MNYTLTIACSNCMSKLKPGETAGFDGTHYFCDRCKGSWLKSQSPVSLPHFFVGNILGLIAFLLLYRNLVFPVEFITSNTPTISDVAWASTTAYTWHDEFYQTCREDGYTEDICRCAIDRIVQTDRRIDLSFDVSYSWNHLKDTLIFLCTT